MEILEHIKKNSISIKDYDEEFVLLKKYNNKVLMVEKVGCMDFVLEEKKDFVCHIFNKTSYPLTLNFSSKNFEGLEVYNTYYGQCKLPVNLVGRTIGLGVRQLTKIEIASNIN